MFRIESNLTLRLINDADRVRDYGEVFTPQRHVRAMLDMLDQRVWSDQHAVFVEPTGGDGAFVTEVLSRRIAGLSRRHGLRSAIVIAITTIYNSDVQGDNVNECRANALRVVLGRLYPNGNETVSNDISFLAAIAAAIKHHIRMGDGLKIERSSFLALTTAEQEQAAASSLDVLRQLVRGYTAAGSWLSKVFRPARRKLAA